jgi:uncharacterized protein
MPTALITGASAGIGAAFARELAARGYNLVLVARSKDKLQQLASDLETQDRIQVDIIVQDLTEPTAGAAVFGQVQQNGTIIDLLINNAGIGDYGDFADSDREFQLKIIQLNIAALVDLTHRFLQPMRQRRSGSIINLSSVAAFQTMPYFSIYSATKAFILSFSEAIWAENQTYNVHVVAVCPGPVGKSFFQESGFPAVLVDAIPLVDTPVSGVVRETLEALQKRQSIVIPGNPTNHVLAAIPRVLPHEAIATLWKTILGFGQR